MSKLIKLCHWLFGNSERVTSSGICLMKVGETEASFETVLSVTGSSESSVWDPFIDEMVGNLTFTTSFPLAKESTFEAPEKIDRLTLI